METERASALTPEFCPVLCRYYDGTPLELDPAYGEQFSQDYCRKIGKLAWDIGRMLKVLEEEQSQAEPEEVEPPRQSVYLAECSYDRMQSWEKLKCELEGHGYRVLPDQPLPRGEADYIDAVETLIGQCSLSIHLVGEHYGAVPYGPSQKSVVVLQNEIAAQSSREGELRRIIWLPDETTSDSPQQQAFIDALHRDPDVQYGADLITSDLQEVKSQAHARLKQQEDVTAEKSTKPNGAAVGQKLVYLICNERDRMATVPVRKFLRESGFEVVIPAFEGDAGAVRKANAQLMADCDGVLLFYGAGDEAWKRTLTNELKKMRGRRGGKPLLARHTFLSGPVTADKQELIAMEEPNLINCVDAFSEGAMAEFMAAMESDGAAA
ncbi:hypothetical protein [Hoeflea sp.]|uniref:hypothetical protein n=1 Tax=Hoeflea sp. TaxID=1940281 RepID=UPI003B02B711